MSGTCCPRDLNLLVWNGPSVPWRAVQRSAVQRARLFTQLDARTCSPYAWAWRASSIFDRIRKKTNQVGRGGEGNFAMVRRKWARPESAS